MKLAYPIIALLTGLISTASAQTQYVPYATSRTLTGDMRIVVESSAEPLLNLWVAGFKKYHPELNIIVSGTSPLAAVPTVASGAYDLGFPARELWPYEEEMFQKVRGYPPTVVLVGLGAYKTPALTPALGVMVNASNPLGRITVDQLEAIFSSLRRRGMTKDVVTWGDLGATGEWANRPIHPYIHRLPNGIDYFIQKTVNRGADFKPSVILLPMRHGKQGPDELIADAVARDPAGIGFASFAYVTSAVKTLAVAETQKGPYYTGTLEEVSSMRYPLARPIYLVLDRAPGAPLPPNLEEFIRYALSGPGERAFAGSGGWLPLPPAVAAAELAKLK